MELGDERKLIIVSVDPRFACTAKQVERVVLERYSYQRKKSCRD